MNALHELALKHGTDKAGHGYTEPYYELFKPHQHAPAKILEIGVGGGGSILMWLEFFSAANIYGVDINKPNGEIDPRYAHVPDPGKPYRKPFDAQIEHPRYHFTQGDQSSVGFWDSFIKSNGGEWDIIIDDGGHTASGIVTSFKELWPHVVSGGLYCIEDLACSGQPGYCNPCELTQMEYLHKLIMHMHRGCGDIAKVAFWRELAVIEKRR